jgi:hypothetical protein
VPSNSSSRDPTPRQPDVTHPDGLPTTLHHHRRKRKRMEVTDADMQPPPFLPPVTHGAPSLETLLRREPRPNLNLPSRGGAQPRGQPVPRRGHGVSKGKQRADEVTASDVEMSYGSASAADSDTAQTAPKVRVRASCTDRKRM